MKKETVFVCLLVTAALCFMGGLILGGVVNRPTAQKHQRAIDTLSQSHQQTLHEIEKTHKNQMSEKARIIAQKDSEIKRLNSISQAAAVSNPQVTRVQPQKKSQEATSTPDVSIIVSKPMFGVYLGEYLGELTKRFKVVKSRYVFKDPDCPAEIWDLQHSNKNIQRLSVHTYRARVYQIEIEFVDGSKTNYEALNQQLSSTYGTKDKGGLTGAMFGEGKFSTQIDGIDIEIKLNHDLGFGEDDKLGLSYLHVPIAKMVYDVIQEQKAAKVQQDL